MAASNLTGRGSLLQGSALDFSSAPLASLVTNPLSSSLNCATFEVQNSGRVNTSILETEQIQLKPGSLLTAITLGESIEATSSCDGISFLKAGAVALSCGAAAQLTVGAPASGAGVVFDTAADTVTVTGPVSAQWARSGVATILSTEPAGRVSVPFTGVSNNSVIVATIKVPQGGSPDATATYVTYIETLANEFQIYVNAQATADVTVAWAILSL
jgi:hypothetical protein